MGFSITMFKLYLLYNEKMTHLQRSQQGKWARKDMLLLCVCVWGLHLAAPRMSFGILTQNCHLALRTHPRAVFGGGGELRPRGLLCECT